MIIPDRKKAVTTILSKFRPEGHSLGGEVKPESHFGNEGHDAERAIAEDVLMAIEHKSVEDLTQALVGLCQLIASKDEEQDEQEG